VAGNICQALPHGSQRLHGPEQRRHIQLPVQHLPPRVVLPREVVHTAVQTRHPVARDVGAQVEIESKTGKQLIICSFQALKPGDQALSTRSHRPTMNSKNTSNFIIVSAAW